MRDWKLNYINDDWQKKYVPNKAGVKTLRGYQTSFFKDLTTKKPQYSQIVAPGGSGKTVLQESLAMQEILDTAYTQRQLILVPQQTIGQQFSKYNQIRLKAGQEPLTWEVVHSFNFCDENSQTIISQLKEWITSPITPAIKRNAKKSGKFHGLVAVASHAALSLAWKQLEEENTSAQMVGYTKNLTFRIDESHHVAWAYLDDDGHTEDEMRGLVGSKTRKGGQNNLGRIVTFLLNQGHKTCRICMTTATSFRHKGLILTSGANNRFYSKFHPMSKHWPTLGLASFRAELEFYKGDPLKKVLASIKAEPEEKHLIVLPPLFSDGRNWRTSNSLPTLMKELKKAFPGKAIMDSVDDRKQRGVKRALIDDQDIDILVTCMMVREGTDWAECSRIHHTCMESSRTLALQTIFRMARQHKDKVGKAAVIRYYQPEFKAVNKIKTREDFSDRLNSILFLSNVEDMFDPWVVEGIETPQRRKEVEVTPSMILGSEYEAILRDAILEIDNLHNERTSDRILEITQELAEEYGCEDVSAAAELTARMYANEWAKSAGIPVLVKGIRDARKCIDLVREIPGIDKVSVAFGGELDTRGWENLSRVMATSLDEWLPYIQEYCAGAL